jgi:hypothetical protein
MQSDCVGRTVPVSLVYVKTISGRFWLLLSYAFRHHAYQCMCQGDVRIPPSTRTMAILAMVHSITSV